MRKNFSDGVVLVTATSFDACQSEITQIMDAIENGAATFTTPKWIKGQWVSTGRIIPWDHTKVSSEMSQLP